MTDLASAQRAIDEILEQGEGPRGHWRDAHFGQFVEILDEYQQLREANPDFDPVRPVIAANVRPPERDVDVPLIGDPLTARVTDLFNVGYEILLQIFERFFAHTEETDAELKALADATVAMMLRVHQAAGRPDHHAPGGPGVPGPDGRAQLRAVLRVRLPDAAPGGGLGAAGRAARRGRRLLRAPAAASDSPGHRLARCSRDAGVSRPWPRHRRQPRTPGWAPRPVTLPDAARPHEARGTAGPTRCWPRSASDPR